MTNLPPVQELSDERLQDARSALDPFIALLDPMPALGDHVEVASLSGGMCDEFVNKALSLTMSDFRALRRVDKLLTELLSASPVSPSPATGVRVKLEWHGDEAKTPFGRYTVTRTDDGYQAAFEWDEIAHVGFNAVDVHYGARRAAQDHAQADYEARIRSALGEQP